MAAISSGDVRSYGIVSSIPSAPRPRALWDKGNARSHRIDLAGIARFSLYPGSWALCCEFFPSKSNLILSADDNRLAGRNVLGQALSTSGEVRINCSTFWLF